MLQTSIFTISYRLNYDVAPVLGRVGFKSLNIIFQFWGRVHEMGE